MTPVSISHGRLLVHCARLWTACGGFYFNGLVTHVRVGVVTSSWHSSHYHLPARPQVMWPTCVGLKAAAALTGEQEDQPTVPPCTFTRRTGRISRVRRRGGFAFLRRPIKTPRRPSVLQCRQRGCINATSLKAKWPQLKILRLEMMVESLESHPKILEAILSPFTYVSSKNHFYRERR